MISVKALLTDKIFCTDVGDEYTFRGALENCGRLSQCGLSSLLRFDKAPNLRQYPPHNHSPKQQRHGEYRNQVTGAAGMVGIQLAVDYVLGYGVQSLQLLDTVCKALQLGHPGLNERFDAVDASILQHAFDPGELLFYFADYGFKAGRLIGF